MEALRAIEGQLRRQHAPESHISRVRGAVDMARSDPAVHAICLVGSYAKGLGDRVSDLDLVAFAAEGAAERVLSAAHRLLHSDQVVNQFTVAHSPAGGFWKFVYLDFSSVEFHVFEQRSGFRLRTPYLPIWDPSNLLSSLVVDGEPVRHEDFEAFEYGDDGLLWDLFDCIKWLSRGRTDLAKRHIVKIAEKIQKTRGGEA